MSKENDEIATLKAELRGLRAEMTELAATQARPFKRPMIDRLGAWGGFLALLVALATGAVTFWDDVVLRGERQEKAQIAELRGWLDEMTRLNTQIQQAQATGNFQHASALVSSFSPTKERLLHSISEVYRERAEVFSDRDILMLANEALALGDKRSADNLVDDILARPSGTEIPELHFELLRLKGRVRGLVGDMHDPLAAREFYREAFFVTDRLAVGTREGLRVNILNEWLQFETTPSGDCDIAFEVLDLAVTELDSQYVAQVALDQYRETIAMTLDMAPARCGLPRRPNG
ncbi:MAG: hypothetical protein AAFV19_05400 [Pseudomonadota bacterium]